MIDAEKSKTCSISSKTAAADAADAAASAAEVSEEIEHVFDFSASSKAQIVVTEGGWVTSESTYEFNLWSFSRYVSPVRARPNIILDT